MAMAMSGRAVLPPELGYKADGRPLAMVLESLLRSHLPRGVFGLAKQLRRLCYRLQEAVVCSSAQRPKVSRFVLYLHACQ